MAIERKVLFLDIVVETMRDRSNVNDQLGELDDLLNEGWDVLELFPSERQGE